MPIDLTQMVRSAVRQADGEHELHHDLTTDETMSASQLEARDLLRKALALLEA